ncbi:MULTISPECIES: excalibur calcium-binding domain-containing protein [Pseudonocardia]|uniref:Excalibur calcium-binding domain protein n=2 Tax=Pseudonocardia TaxID=1847 RepID=A0A1Y2MTL7_PSEAH|nr:MULTISPECIES: excalibur calcium-binding domain-containing protein [Pseudonocardia]OSY38555.1 Excalibur calcium-binding domain protein [Pseudonocardia autotrophica]TDN77002.1 endonuclease YncB(thermonuclease family) [Pseudonocardia autotrophica]BBG01008.1 hypothetical protein Pdca_22170 [Pseudonocardia autotrophica]GEC29226.1 hypothetical protein PSA01_62550 [Pseudonocardia saturnea]
MSKAGLLGTVLLVTGVVYACSGPDSPGTDTAVDTAAAHPSASAPAAAAAPATAPGSDGASSRTGFGVDPDTVVVTSVIDGDTFRVGDRRIRVIGIDSCEVGTTGGDAATAAARRLLTAGTVTLTREPGVDLDRFGREVRYVAVSAGDLGRLMVPADHTGVYRGGENASASYLSGLTGLDRGRSCGPFTTAATDTDTAGTARPAPAPAPAAAPAPAPASSPPATRAPAPLQAAPRTAAPRPTAAPQPAVQAPPPAPSGGGGVYYKNCSAARAAGAAPILRGQPGYRGPLDRDNDGVACE